MLAVNPEGHVQVFPAAGFWLQQLVAGHVYAPFAEVPPVAKTPPNVAGVLASPPPLELALLPLPELPPLELALVPPLLELALLPPLLELASSLPLPELASLPPLLELAPLPPLELPPLELALPAPLELPLLPPLAVPLALPVTLLSAPELALASSDGAPRPLATDVSDPAAHAAPAPATRSTTSTTIFLGSTLMRRGPDRPTLITLALSLVFAWC